MKFSVIAFQVIVWLVPIPVSSCVDGPSPCCVVEEVATSTRSTALRAIAAWRPRPAWLVLTSVCSAGGQCVRSYCLQESFGGKIQNQGKFWRENLGC